MDPATVAEVAAAIIGKIGEMNERSAAEKWKSEVTSKLNTIIAQNSQIIALLRDLFLFVPQQLEIFFNTEAVIRSNALTNQFEIYIAANPPNVRAIREMRDESELAALDLIERGPSIYQAANAAALFVLAVYKIARNVDRRERAQFIDQVVGRMNDWLSDKPGMFGAALKEEVNKISQNRTGLGQIPRGSVELYSSESRVEIGGGEFPRTMPCRVFLRTNIQIDEINLTRSPLDPEVGSDCGELSLRDDIVQAKISEMRSLIDGYLNAIKDSELRKTVLQTHIAALTKMVDDLKHA